MAYIGTYTGGESEGIYAAQLLENGRLGTPKPAARAENPSYLVSGPDGRTLYAVLETGMFQGKPGGGVASYDIGEDGALTQTGLQPSLGAYPCHLCTSPDGAFLFVANYGNAERPANQPSDATVVVFLIEHGAVGPALQKTSHAGHGAHPVRQLCPHSHFVGFSPDGHLCAVDLGMDMIFTYVAAPSGALYEVWQTRFFPGCGPRHLVFLPQARTAYAVNELSGDLTLLRVGPQGGFTPEAYYPTVPDGFSGQNLPAAVRLSPDGSLLAVSNRGHDSIAVYRPAANGCLSNPVFTPCGGNGPRDLAFSPDGRFLYAANEISGNITAFAVENGGLVPLGETVRVDKPVCIRFVQI